MYIQTNFQLVLPRPYGAGQIGPQLNLNKVQKQFQQFLSSRTGIIFLNNTLFSLNPKFRFSINSSKIKAAVIQQGRFQFVLKVTVKSLHQKAINFCLILSKENSADNTTKMDFMNLKKYHSLYPGHFVEPLILNPGAPTLYTTRFYEKHLELDYKIDGRNGRNGLFINTADLMPFSLEEQNPLLEEMVKILAMAYDQKTGEAIFRFFISAGDFIVNYRDLNSFSMRLITVRDTNILDIPTFVWSLINYNIKLESPTGACIRYLFDENTVFAGLVKAFKQKEGLLDEEANRKAAIWLSEYHRELERGTFKPAEAGIEAQFREHGFTNLPRSRHVFHK